MWTVTMYSTGECNLRCTHCSVGLDQYDPRTPLTTGEFKQALTSLAEAGTGRVTILGGEATIYRQDIAELLDHAFDCGLRIAINTNATARSIILGLAEKPALRELVISLDGPDAAIHDSIRGRGMFKRTTRTIREVAGTARAASGELQIKLAHVISAANCGETGRMVPLGIDLGAHTLSVKHVRIIGRATEHRDELELSHRQLLHSYSELMATWLVTGEIGLDVQLPHALAYYLHRRFGVPYPDIATQACAGTSQYGYVDLLGNHLPCPAMSYEEDAEIGIPDRVPELNLVSSTAKGIRREPVFVEFERQRTTFARRQQMFPCMYCRFSDLSSPCTADLVKGASTSEVDACAAVLLHGDEAVPGIRRDVFSAYPRSSGSTVP